MAAAAAAAVMVLLLLLMIEGSASVPISVESGAATGRSGVAPGHHFRGRRGYRLIGVVIVVVVVVMNGAARRQG